MSDGSLIGSAQTSGSFGSTHPSSLFGLHPIQFTYLSVLVCTIVALLVMNYWILTRASTNRIRYALNVHNAAILWALAAAVGLLVDHQQLSLWLASARTLLAYITTILFVRFATLYSGRSMSLRRPFNAAFLGAMSIGLFGLLTHPWHGLHFDPLSFHTEPFPYVETGHGPLWLFALLAGYAGMVVALYYFAELAVTSQHRSRRPLIAYSIGLGLATLPSFLTATGQVPTLPGYDHGVFALGIASIAFFSGAWLGMVKIAPISRDRLLATTEDALLVVDDAGRIADYNPVAERFLVDTAAAVGRPLSSAAPAIATALETSESAGPQPVISESRTVEFTEGDRRYSMVVSPVIDRNDVHGAALLARDVTDRHEREHELRRQNEQFEAFASSISHHLRNPLQIASGHAALARQHLDASDTEIDPEERDMLDDMQHALDRTETIITDLQTLARRGTPVESTTRIVFDEAVDQAVTHLSIDRATVSVPQTGTLEADHGRLLSILENLVRNGVDHAGPDVTITARLTDDGFVVEDDGPGVDADHDRLFEYGYTTSDDGTGLGLSIVETMVESHGWRIELDPDHAGARFVVTGVVTDLAAGSDEHDAGATHTD